MGDCSKENGWVLMHRSIRDSWIWSKKPFSIGQAWMDMILDVNHDVGKFYLNGKLKTVKRGQKWTSIRTLAERWGWRNGSVLDFLNALEEDGMIKRESSGSGTLITLVNYGKYQDVRNTKRNDNGTIGGTKSERSRNETKKDKRRIKEGKKEKSLPSEEEKATEDDGWFESLEDDNDTTEH